MPIVRSVPLVALLLCGSLTACGVGYLTFKAEAKRLENEALQKFPIGSDVAAFETWFKAKGDWLHHVGSRRATCTVRQMAIQRYNYCVDLILVDYCVNDMGRIEDISFHTSGYC